MHHVRISGVVLPFIVMSCLLQATPPSVALAESNHVFHRAGSAGLRFFDPVSVAVNRGGGVYVFQRGTSSVDKLSPQGRLLATWPVKIARSFPGPGRMAIDGAGNIVVLLGNSRQRNTYVGGIEKLAPTGHVLARWYNASLLNAELVAAGTGGNVFAVVPVTIEGGARQTGRVVKLSASGRVVGRWLLSTAGYDFMAPAGLATDAQGKVYVSGSVGSCSRGCQGSEADLIERFTRSGTALPRLQYLAGTVARGPGLTVDGRGNIYSGGDSLVVKLSPTGQVVTQWGGMPGCNPLQYRAIAGLAIDGQNNLYVVDESNDNLQKLNIPAQSVTLWGGCPSSAPPAPILDERRSSVTASPRLNMACGLPNGRGIVSCALSGRGFRPRERLRITYHITFTSLPRRHGQLPQQWYRRIATSDGTGTFRRPPLTFSVVRYHESFWLVVTVVGSAGDRASTTVAQIAQ